MTTATATNGKRLTKEGQCCVCFNLRKASRAVTALYEEAMRSTGLRATQLSMLGAASAFGPVTITQLAEGLVIDRTTLTRNVTLLQKKGLLAVEPGADKRERRIAITAHGRRLMSSAYPLWKDVQHRLTKELGMARAERLLDDLAALVKAAKCC